MVDRVTDILYLGRLGGHGLQLHAVEEDHLAVAPAVEREKPALSLDPVRSSVDATTSAHRIDHASTPFLTRRPTEGRLHDGASVRLSDSMQWRRESRG